MNRVLLPVFLLLLSACAALPPGVFDIPASNPSGPSLPPTLTSTETPVFLQVSGSWRCHNLPGEENDTLVFLHDGEIVLLLEEQDKWLLVQAGKKTCFVNEAAFDEK